MRWLLFLCLVTSGCGDDDATDASLTDSGDGDVSMDGTPTDGPPDTGLPPSDTSPPDTSPDGGPPDIVWFSDVSVAAGIDLVRNAADDYQSVPDRMSGGVCVIDVDGLAPLDLFFAFRPSATSGSALYVGRGSLDYTDETAARGLTNVGDATGCLAFDAEGDGDEDLLVTGTGSIRLFENDGGVFRDVTLRLGFTPDPRDFYAGAAAGDVDGDGDLDLVVAGMVRYDPAGMPARCGAVPCTGELINYAPIASLLFIRRPDGGYDEDAASEAPALALEEATLVVAVRDLDTDGRPDIYVGNDIGGAFRDRVLSRRIDGNLRDVAEDLGLAYNRVGYGMDTMGFASGDLDGDGDLDHVETSFEGDATAVFVCEDAICEDRAVRAGTSALENSFRWAAVLGDLDLDGDLDLLEAAGHFYDTDEATALGFEGGREQPMNLLDNLGDARFRVVARLPEDGTLRPGAERSIALVDLDDDGLLDAVTAPAVGAVRVLRNVHPPAGHFLRVRLSGRAPNADAVGARVVVSAGATSVLRVQSRGDGYLGNSSPRLHFGFTESGVVDVDVTWPDGRTTAQSGVPVDGEVTISEP